MIDGQLSKTGLVLVAVGDVIVLVQIHGMVIERFFNFDMASRDVCCLYNEFWAKRANDSERNACAGHGNARISAFRFTIVFSLYSSM